MRQVSRIKQSPADSRVHASVIPYLALAGGVIGIAWAAIFVKWAGVPGAPSAFWRLAFASVVLLPWQGARLPLRPLLRAQRAARLPGVERIPAAARIAVIGGVFFALVLAFWNQGLLYTSAANATLMANTAPLWVGLGAWLLLRERLTPWFWLGMAAAMAGAALILGGDLFHPSLAGMGTSRGLVAGLGTGDLLALAAGFFYGMYQLAAGRARATLSTPVVMTLATAAGAGVLLAACLLLGAPLAGYAPRAWLMLLLLGIVSQLGGVQLVNYAFGHLPTPVVSVTLLAQPPLVAFLGALLLGESIRPIQVLGGALVLLGIYVVHRLGR